MYRIVSAFALKPRNVSHSLLNKGVAAATTHLLTATREGGMQSFHELNFMFKCLFPCQYLEQNCLLHEQS